MVSPPSYGYGWRADVEEDYDCYVSDSEVSNLALADNNASLRPLLESSKHQSEDKTKYAKDYIYRNQLSAASVEEGDGDM
jgi:hypothetical protein